MAGIVERLTALLSLEVDEQSFNEGEQDIDGVTDSLKTMGTVGAAAMTALGVATLAWVNDFAVVADETNKLARRVGTTAEVIQELDFVAERSGVSINLMRNSIEKLNAKASQATAGATEMQKVFQELGLSSEALAAADPGDQMDMIAAAMARLPSDADRTRIAMKLFEEKGRAMVTVFEGGSEALAQMRQEARDLGLFSSEDAAAAETYNDELLAAGMAFKSIRNEVGAALIPTLTELLIKFKDFFVQNRELISQGIVGMIEGLGHALKIAGVMAALFLQYKIGAAVLALANAFRVFGNAAMIAQLKALLIPIAIGAAITAVVLLAQDIYKFFSSDGKAATAFGDFIDLISDTTGFKSLGKFIGTIVDSFKSLVKWVTDATTALQKFFNTKTDAELEASAASARERWQASGGVQYGGYGARFAPMAVANNATNTSSSTVVNDNRVYDVNGADTGEVKRIIEESNSFAAKVGDTAVEY